MVGFGDALKIANLTVKPQAHSPQVPKRMRARKQGLSELNSFKVENRGNPAAVDASRVFLSDKR
jgi:hypothetical protein